MRVMLFGAGASFGSEPSARVPPLGPQLFDELARFAPATWGALPTPWPSRFRSDFEPAMAAFISAGGFGAPLQWDMATYFYTQFTATLSSTYVTLFKVLADTIDQYLFTTLNYELLLFQARVLAGIPRGKLAVCLPHGSSCVCCTSISGSAWISFTGGISTEGAVRVFRDPHDFITERHRNVFPPVMSYYEPNKFAVSGANFIRDERVRLKNTILSADRIALIGVRVHPVDKHIWGPLARTKARIIYLSGASAAVDFSTWTANENRIDDLSVPKYFGDGIGDLSAFLG
jgi:hypothetical protein